MLPWNYCAYFFRLIKRCNGKKGEKKKREKKRYTYVKKTIFSLFPSPWLEIFIAYLLYFYLPIIRLMIIGGRFSRLNRSDSQKHSNSRKETGKSIMNSSCAREFVQYVSSIVIVFTIYIRLVLYNILSCLHTISRYIEWFESGRATSARLFNHKHTNIWESNSGKTIRVNRLTFDDIYNSCHRNQFIVVRFTLNTCTMLQWRKFFFSFSHNNVAR